jgi:hypothetical protein
MDNNVALTTNSADHRVSSAWLWEMISRRTSIGLILLCLFVGNLAIYAAMRPDESLPTRAEASRTYPVGHFQIRAISRGSAPAHIDTDVSLTLTGPEIDLAVEKLEEHKYWVRRDVTDILRRARPTELSEPRHTELKEMIRRLLQTLIGYDSISEVHLGAWRLVREQTSSEGTLSGGIVNEGVISTLTPSDVAVSNEERRDRFRQQFEASTIEASKMASQPGISRPAGPSQRVLSVVPTATSAATGPSAPPPTAQ